MSVKFKTVKNKFPEMQERLQALNGKTIEIGCIQGGHTWLAAIHEYGCNIPVTPKMRAFLHYKGIHLNKNTTVIKIPERSFLRTGHDKSINDVMDQIGLLLGQVVGGTMTEQQLLEAAGLLLSTKIKEYATELSKPPNSSFTVEEKGSSNPLVDTGAMIGGISFRVK